MDRTIGQGAFALVKRAHLIKNRSKVFAVKFIHLSSSKRSGLSEQQIGQEILLHRACSGHPNIIKLMDYGADTNWLWIAMELAPGGDLFDKIEPDYGVDEEIAHFYFKQLISSIEFIHQKGVAHRDIKPENILLDSQGNLKLADFGLAAVYKTKSGKRRQCTTPCGSPPYMAPEVASFSGYDPTGADLWSCGIVLYVLLTGQTPWEEPTLQDTDFTNFVENDGKIHSFPWSKFDPLVLSLLRSLLKPDSSKRISIENIRKHLWVNKSNIFTNDLNGLCKDTTLLTARLLNNLHIGLDDDTSNDEKIFSTYNNEQLQSPLKQQVAISQPEIEIAGMIDDEEIVENIEVFPSTQEYFTEHLKKKRRLLESKQDTNDELILNLISKDPLVLQFMNDRSRSNKLKELKNVPQQKLFGERLTRFFSILPIETLISKLFDTLHRIGVKTKNKNEKDLIEQYHINNNSNDPIYITLTTLDRRKLPLKGSIKITKMSDSLNLRKIDFIKTKGDPLEWRKFFKTCTVLCKDIVYIDNQNFNNYEQRQEDKENVLVGDNKARETSAVEPGKRKLSF